MWGKIALLRICMMPQQSLALLSRLAGGHERLHSMAGSKLWSDGILVPSFHSLESLLSGLVGETAGGKLKGKPQ